MAEIPLLQRARSSVLNLWAQIDAKAKHWEAAVAIGLPVAPTADSETLLALAICASRLNDVAIGRPWVDKAIALDPSPEFKLRVLDKPGLQLTSSGTGRPLWKERTDQATQA